jgi:hypothetical protein
VTFGLPHPITFLFLVVYDTGCEFSSHGGQAGEMLLIMQHSGPLSDLGIRISVGGASRDPILLNNTAVITTFIGYSLCAKN